MFKTSLCLPDLPRRQEFVIDLRSCVEATGGWEGGREVESLPEKRALFCPVSTSTLDSKKGFRREICSVTRGGVWKVLYQF